MLEAVESEGKRVIAKVYGIPAEQLRVFVHYVPQFYQLHVHFTRLHNEMGCQAERAHLVSDIVQHLRADGDWYLKRNIQYKPPVTVWADALSHGARVEQSASAVEYTTRMCTLRSTPACLRGRCAAQGASPIRQWPYCAGSRTARGE